ncbi:gluconate 2-dehydrogenase gamma chain [Psychrobacillus psychrotolerans]|uniref:Gluconate 2-dehydrogenase gamma chain n=1 Tax=Psychrobacillus psychrotolerans TaxID=126156 RepID=A0A1I5XYK7_9BACI|nr:gluconate 2-dehydrogenase subunit 3 family protein [Psychrobacillus psychrotolerans]SFQ37009.1 gluconate 2-dehydrogenase gamma chain [Psychrobacillus psychrotolerans]
MTEQKKNTPVLDKRSSRRTFIKNSGLTVGGVVLGGALGSLLLKDGKTTTNETNVHSSTAPSNPNVALMYFTPEQYRITEAASERIFPKDENGPGAKELLVAYYIDHQLSGAWGMGSKEYTSGPFFPGEDTQGYQGRQNRQQIFEIGLKGIQDHSLKTYDKSFIELSEDEQDAILTEFADGNVELKGVSSAHFFGVLRTATIEGAYADPLYGGNANMEGWKMKNFPGHQMSFLDIIEKEFTKIEPMALNSQHKH